MNVFPLADFDVELMEICCPPDSRLVQTFLDKGRKALRIGLPAVDFGSKKGLREVLAMIDRWKPKLVWFSLPCGPYSPIQGLFNESTEESKQKSEARKKEGQKDDPQWRAGYETSNQPRRRSCMGMAGEQSGMESTPSSKTLARVA